MKPDIGLKWLIGIMIGLLAAGCATTDDPRQGGLFGYNPSAYERRIAEREARLRVLQDEQAKQLEQAKLLEESAAQKRDEKDEAARKLADLDADLAKLERSVRNSKVRTKAQERQIAKLQSQLQTVKEQRGEMQYSSDTSNQAEKQKQIEDLQGQIDQLLKEAEALSKM